MCKISFRSNILCRRPCFNVYLTLHSTRAYSISVKTFISQLDYFYHRNVLAYTSGFQALTKIEFSLKIFSSQNFSNINITSVEIADIAA